MLILSDNLQDKSKALQILKSLFDVHGQNDKVIQSKYLNVLVEVNLAEATKIQ
jgi:hypothetical protein